MPELKGTKTEQNLLKSFAGESQARGRYTMFASVARKEGYVQISNIFDETARNEYEHSKVFFKYLEGGDLEITAAYPAGKIGTTVENLIAAAEGEALEWGTLYPDFAQTAEEEGFLDVAESYKEIAKVEAWHEKRYRKLAENLKTGQVFKRPETQMWLCSNCGYVFEGTEAPPICPACKHPQAFYEIYPANY